MDIEFDKLTHQGCDMLTWWVIIYSKCDIGFDGDIGDVFYKRSLNYNFVGIYAK